MPKTYADWLKAEETNINPSAPAIVKQNATIGNTYAALMLKNEQIRNTPEVAPSYSAYAQPVAASPFDAPVQKVPTAAPVSNPAMAGSEATNPAGVEKKAESSTATGDGYAAWLAQHPEYAEAERNAENEYARSRSTYGALAERMAQAGIHGGYGEYLDSAAYAQMQNAKADIDKQARAGYADYLNGKTGGASSGLYSYLTGGSYTDADGNTVQGYNLLDMTDEQYEAYKPTIKSILTESGKYTQAQIDEAFAGVERTRATAKDTAKGKITSAVDSVIGGTGSEEDIVKAYQNAYGVKYDLPEQNEGESDEEYAERVAPTLVKAAKDIVINEYKNGTITQEQASAYLKDGLSLYEEGFNEKGWKDAGEEIYSSVRSAEKWLAEGYMTESDFDKVLNDAVKQTGIKLVTTGGDLSGFFGTTSQNDDVTFAIYKDGKKEVTIKADRTTTKDAKGDTLTALQQYKNSPLAVYKDGIYFQYKPGTWVEISTKAGTKGTPKQGNNYLYTIALYMMRQNNYKGVGTSEMVGKINVNQ